MKFGRAMHIDTPGAAGRYNVQLFEVGLEPKKQNISMFVVSSRVCAVAQYAVLEANAKVNGRGPF